MDSKVLIFIVFILIVCFLYNKKQGFSVGGRRNHHHHRHHRGYHHYRPFFYSGFPRHYEYGYSYNKYPKHWAYEYSHHGYPRYNLNHMYYNRRLPHYIPFN